MPTNKSPKNNKTEDTTTEAKAVVSSLGVNDTPKPTKPVEKVTAHGNTITSH